MEQVGLRLLPDELEAATQGRVEQGDGSVGRVHRAQQVDVRGQAELAGLLTVGALEGAGEGDLEGEVSVATLIGFDERD